MATICSPPTASGSRRANGKAAKPMEQVTERTRPSSRVKRPSSTVRRSRSAWAAAWVRSVFSPGFSFAYVADPDGYEIEIWFE